MAPFDNNDSEVCLACCNRTDLLTWRLHARIIRRNKKIGVVVDEDGQRTVIVPIEFDTWFTYEGYEIKIEADFFDEWWNCIGYFANKNDDDTYTCYEFDKEGHLMWLFTCESFDKDTITINGKKYIGRSSDQEGFDDVVRLGYETLSGTDNCYFALRQGKKWSLKSDDLKDTYLDYTECDEISSIARTPVGMNVVVKKGDKQQLFIRGNNGTLLTLIDSYDCIQVIADYFVNDHDDVDCRGSFLILYEGKKLAICSDDLRFKSPFIFDHFGETIDRNEIMVERFGKRMPYHIINADGFGITAFRSFNEDEKAFVMSNEVVAAKVGKSVRFSLRTGADKFIPLSEYSLLSIGDSIDLKNAMLLILSREGYSDIYQIVETQIEAKNVLNTTEKSKTVQGQYPIEAIAPLDNKICKEENKVFFNKKRTVIKDSFIGIIIALISISALLLLLFSKEAAIIAFIIGVIIPFIVGIVFCTWTLAKDATTSTVKTVILAVLIIGLVAGGLFLLSNANWGNDSRMEQIDSQRPDRF